MRALACLIFVFSCPGFASVCEDVALNAGVGVVAGQLLRALAYARKPKEVMLNWRALGDHLADDNHRLGELLQIRYRLTHETMDDKTRKDLQKQEAAILKTFVLKIRKSDVGGNLENLKVLLRLLPGIARVNVGDESAVTSLVRERLPDILPEGIGSPIGPSQGADFQGTMTFGDKQVDIHLSAHYETRGGDALIVPVVYLSQDGGKPFTVPAKGILIGVYNDKGELVNMARTRTWGVDIIVPKLKEGKKYDVKVLGW